MYPSVQKMKQILHIIKNKHKKGTKTSNSQLLWSNHPKIGRREQPKHFRCLGMIRRWFYQNFKRKFRLKSYLSFIITSQSQFLNPKKLTTLCFIFLRMNQSMMGSFCSWSRTRVLGRTSGRLRPPKKKENLSFFSLFYFETAVSLQGKVVFSTGRN